MNVVNGNTLFIDSAAAGPLGPVGSRVYAIIFSGIGGNARLTLADTVAGDTKFDVACLQNDTKILRMLEERPVVFPSGITVVTATNVRATLILNPQR